MPRVGGRGRRVYYALGADRLMVNIQLDPSHDAIDTVSHDRPPQVPKGISSQPESVDAVLCRRVARISRVSVPAVSFQLAGLAAAAVLHFLRTPNSARLARGGTATAKQEEGFRRKGAVNQWMFVDELDSGLSGSSPGGDVRPFSERHEKRINGENKTARDGGAR